MRTGLILSIAGHVGLIAAGLVAFPEARPFIVPSVEALPVELVPVADLRDVVAGDREAEIKPEEAPQPKPKSQADVAAPKAADKPSTEVVEGAREPAEKPIRDVTEQPRPEAPRQEAVAAPTKEAEPAPPPPEPVAAPPKPAEPTVEPEPEPETAKEEIAPAPMPPKARPAPPRHVAAITPPRHDPQRATRPEARTPPAPQPAFNPDDIAALLNKQESRGGGDPNPSSEPQTFGTSDGRIEAAMTQSEIDALKARLYSCWNPPRGVREAGQLTVTVSISLQPDGRLAAPPQVVGGGFDPLSQIAAESAVRAVQMCAPYDILPPEKYSLWREIEFIFDPSEMLGG